MKALICYVSCAVTPNWRVNWAPSGFCRGIIPVRARPVTCRFSFNVRCVCLLFDKHTHPRAHTHSHTHTHTYSSWLAAEQASPLWPKKNQLLDKTQNTENIALKKTNWNGQTLCKTPVSQRDLTNRKKTTLKPEAQKFMMHHRTSRNFGEDEKHKILLYFSPFILLIRCRGRQENAKAKWAADICLWLISAADNQRRKSGK